MSVNHMRCSGGCVQSPALPDCSSFGSNDHCASLGLFWVTVGATAFDGSLRGPYDGVSYSWHARELYLLHISCRGQTVLCLFTTPAKSHMSKSLSAYTKNLYNH